MDTDQNAEIARHQREWRPWLYRFLMAPARIGCLVIGAWCERTPGASADESLKTVQWPLSYV